MTCKVPQAMETKAECRHCAKADCEHGFTLIEIMVVMVIIGVMLTAVVSLRGGGQQHRYLQDEAARLVILAGLARQQSIQAGMPVRILFSSSGYRFESWSINDSDSDDDNNRTSSLSPEKPEGQWQSIDTGNLRAYQPERQVLFTLITDQSRDKRSIILFPDGTSTAARIQIRLPDWMPWIELKTDGFSVLEQTQYEK
ncbi:pilus assembly FimT family protein [Oceanospirillum sediminis]|uniref:Type II secretion system protein H n=1 Tax=Oceanospirillum sediminis TaxID=2760088 RepID=A0A839IN03_9GAMM|nr:GspH/FimT family pseudopilin [Oceanospirillum sediminis]MBB1485857.1 GspH/FimT family pseudopilin [Oceanospirillum sediminis]